MQSTAGRRLQETLHGVGFTGAVAVKEQGSSVSSFDPNSHSPSASEIGPSKHKKAR